MNEGQEGKTRVALFGGGFDPPHNAHKEIPIFLLNHKLVDEVWYVPVKNHPFGKKLSPDQDRVAMIQEVIDQLSADHPEYANAIRLETWELDRTDTDQSYSIKTLDGLAKKYPEHSFKFVIGTDNLEKFHLWPEHKRILDQYGVFVYPRSCYFAKPLQVGMHFLGNAPLIKVSSTQIREELSTGQDTSADSLVLPSVIQYATSHHLYEKKTD